MRKILFLTAILIALTSCATTNHEKTKEDWVGTMEPDLIKKWGSPQHSYVVNGRKFLTYSSSRSMHLPGMAPAQITTFIDNVGYANTVGGSPGRNMELSCQTTFEISDEKIVSWYSQGNNCMARE